MAIDTFKYYHPKMKQLIYGKITTERQNDYTLFNEYEIRVPDEENGDEGPYNYTHNTILIGKEVVEWSDVPDLFIAYTAKARDREEAVERIHPGKEGSFDSDDEVLLLLFMRVDEAKKFILNEEKIHTPQSIEASEREEYTDSQ